MGVTEVDDARVAQHGSFLLSPHIGSIIAYVSFVIATCLILAWVIYVAVPILRDRRRCCPRIGIAYSDEKAYGDSLTWDGEPIDYLSRTLFILWNGGIRKITHVDLSDVEPVRVAVAGRILEYQVLAAAAPSVSTELEGQSTVRLRFDQLNGIFDNFSLKNLTEKALVGYDRTHEDFLKRVTPADWEIFNRSRGLCLEIIHDGREGMPAQISGRMGEVSIGERDDSGKLKANRDRRPALALLVLLAVFSSDALWWWAKNTPSWVQENFFTRRGIAWEILLGLSLAVIVVVLWHYWEHMRPARAWDPRYDDVNRVVLWGQYVPFSLRGGPDITEESFLMRTKSRRTAFITPVTYYEAALRVLRSVHHPLTTRELTDQAVKRGLIRPRGKNAAATMAAALHRRLRGDSELVKLATPRNGQAQRGSVRWTLRRSSTYNPRPKDEAAQR
jgi:hypothetical protein